MPYRSFHRSAKVLDRQRLGKQRIEAKQILKILSGESTGKGWRNHPAVLMWRGFEVALAEYGLAICNEWCLRGYKDQQWGFFSNWVRERSIPGRVWIQHPPLLFPPWLGSKKFHASHRSNLLRKDPKHYGQFGWKESPDLPYVWPVKNEVSNARKNS